MKPMVFPTFFSWPGFSGFNFPLNQSIDTSVFLPQVNPLPRPGTSRKAGVSVSWTCENTAPRLNKRRHGTAQELGWTCWFNQHGESMFFLKGHVENLMDWDLMRTSGFGWEFFTNRIRSWEYLASEAPENSGVPVFFQPTGGPTLCWLIIVINIPFMGLSSRSCRCRWTYSQEKNMKVFTNSEVVSWTKTHDIPMV